MKKSPIDPDIMEKLYRRLSYENGRLLMKLSKIEIEQNQETENVRTRKTM